MRIPPRWQQAVLQRPDVDPAQQRPAKRVVPEGLVLQENFPVTAQGLIAVDPFAGQLVSEQASRTMWKDMLDILAFARLQRGHPGVKDVLLRLLAEQLQRATDRVVEAHFVDADTRVRRRVAELASAYADGDDAPVVPLTQEDLAAMAGTSRATVNRVLREEEKRGTLALRRGRVTLLDPDGLDRRCRWGS